jgi:hypothetical protein
VDDVRGFYRALATLKPGDRARVYVLRAGREGGKQFVMLERPARP